MAVTKPAKLANSAQAWVSLSRTFDTPFIQSLDEFDESVERSEFRKSPLGALPKSAVQTFRSHLRFVEMSVNGKIRRRFLLSCYFGDLVKKHGFSDDQLRKVASLFGVGPRLFGQLYHHFGDFGPDEEIICRRRPYFFCGRYVP